MTSVDVVVAVAGAFGLVTSLAGADFAAGVVVLVTAAAGFETAADVGCVAGAGAAAATAAGGAVDASTPYK